MQRSIQVSSVYWSQSASDELLSAIIDFVERHGTVRGLVARMEAIGLGPVARSWLYSGAYEPILSEQPPRHLFERELHVLRRRRI
jgi:uncharacterized protein YidB (DUF937 family)